MRPIHDAEVLSDAAFSVEEAARACGVEVLWLQQRVRQACCRSTWSLKDGASTASHWCAPGGLRTWRPALTQIHSWRPLRRT